MIRIAIATSHPPFRHRLRALLSSDPGFTVVAEAADADECAQVATAHHPDILLLDIATPHGTVFDVLEQIAARAPSVRVLVITANVDSRVMVRALKAGARGVVLREDATPVLFTSIRSVMQGEHWVDRTKLGLLIEEIRREPAGIASAPRVPNRYNLTMRELDVIAAVVSGESNREIATRLSIREDTVKHHLSHIFDKLGVFSRLELAVFAMNHGLAGDTTPPTVTSGARPNDPHRS